MMTLEDFLKIELNDKWYYFDYKYMFEWFDDKQELLDNINWNSFGYDKTGKDSTLWIGSKGAHTICHQDSYGCNLVCQIHGRKEWLLFPPETGKFLKRTRLPYEESTVYSQFNFFSPSEEEEEIILTIDTNPIVIVLEPGDVLLVPRAWWHFVESLELSVSVNVWLPLVDDSKARLKESLVKLFMTRIGDDLPSTDKSQCSLEESIDLIGNCLKECSHVLSEEYNNSSCNENMESARWTADNLSIKYPNYIKKLNYLSKEQFKKFLIAKRIRFAKSIYKNNDNNLSSDDLLHKNVLEAVVKSICHSDVIDKIADLLLTNE
ncbi:HSPB1-associated protein 1 isoform X2 [Aphidius gifuensis]|nr:HSPB1-associated protein 1 isoform X2 [Aphidius gifuensis]